MSQLKAKPIPDISSIKVYQRLLQGAMPYWWAFALGVLGNILIAVSDGLLAYYFEPLIEKGFIARDEFFIRWIPGVIIIFFIARGGGLFYGHLFYGLGRP